jgi:hypothetical protein
MYHAQHLRPKGAKKLGPLWFFVTNSGIPIKFVQCPACDWGCPNQFQGGVGNPPWCQGCLSNPARLRL